MEGEGEKSFSRNSSWARDRYEDKVDSGSSRRN